MKLLAGAASDVGRVREGNEDAVRVDERLHLFAVADGMGGHRAGEVASATALEALRAAVAAGRPISEAIESANAAVFAKAHDDENLRGMGTTLTAAVLSDGDSIVIGHVGDSRAYRFHEDELEQITEDHSLVEELVREGRLTPEQAVVHPQRSIITRALGVDEDVQVDVYPIELSVGDRVLLCSDGLTTMVRPTDIARILRREHDPQRAAEMLVDAANAAGGEDNVTAVVLDAASDDGPGDAVDLTTANPVTPAARPEPRPDEGPVERASAVEAVAAESLPTPIRLAPRGTTRRIFRLLVWLLPVALVVGVAVGAVAWYARKAFYVTFDAGRVTLFRGRPGGVLGFEPTIEQRTSLRASDLTQADQADVHGKKKFTDKTRAVQYISALQHKADEMRAVAATTTTTAPIPPPTPASNAPIGP
ncbi:MAG: Stp1/IreP family PP2C-type Ser/Thr phosphatase [Actinobacteria bacterium]|nr:Stp1/IreP family PP2C-type Ser/Thr phosphatase [Actinomycetota bacterium]